MQLDLHIHNVFKDTPIGELPQSWRTFFIGRPLATADAPHQTIGKVVGLAVFASDALSSTAYATQEILMILALAGAGAFRYTFPIALAIVALMTIVAISYEQTIHAYPGGGGAYIVARDNLGEVPAQAAGAALLTDYTLTVAVSISSGVAQIVSAVPVLYPYRVWIAAGLVLFVMMINLRGVKESGVTFAIPTYFFVVTMFLTVGFGLFKALTGQLGTVVNPPEMHVGTAVAALTPFLILHAFSSGTSALTGIEAISNGITAFKEPRSRNAGITLIWMATILASLFLGVTFIAQHVGAVPSETETVISQLARTVYGSQGLLYFLVMAGTSVILVMAATTAFADFPRLGALQAGDGFLPRQLTYRGSRLVFSRGIMSLAAIAITFIVLFQASVTRLIPLYAIGVFLSFTLSQSGMAHRWWKVGHLKKDETVVEPGSTLRYEKNWMVKMFINGFGAVCTFVVMIVFAVTKFHEGAWVVTIIIPFLVIVFLTIHRHYKGLARQLSLEHGTSPNGIKRNRVVLLVGGVHQGTLAALRYARNLTDDITAVHIATDPVEAEKIRAKWEVWGEGARLIILESPFRLFMEPLLDYLAKLEKLRKPGQLITIVVPQFVPKKPIFRLLHSRTAEMLRKVLLNQEDMVIIEVPYQVE